MLPHIIQQPNLPSPLLPNNRPNLLRRQHKPNTPLRIRRTQFQRPAVIRPANGMVVIPRIARREVQNLTPRTGEVRAVSLTRSFDRRRRARRRFEHAIDALGQGIAGETPRREDQLAVRMEIDKTADAMRFARGESGGETVEGGVLGGVAWSDSAVGLPAGVRGGAA